MFVSWKFILFLVYSFYLFVFGFAESLAAYWPSLVRASRSCFPVMAHGLLIAVASLAVKHMGSRCVGSVAVAGGHKLSLPLLPPVCGIFPPVQGSNSYPLHWQVNS